MGEIIIANPRDIVPTQQELDEYKLEKCIAKHLNGSKLSYPFPVKKSSRTGKFLLIDGHHNLSVLDLLEKKCCLYLVNNKNDFMNPRTFPGMVRKTSSQEYKQKEINILIRTRFEIVDSKERDASIPKTIRELRENYYFLRNLESAKKYFGF